jgi:hypothetical protein
MNYYLLIYVLLCIAIGLGGTAVLAQTGRGLGAIAFLIGSILVFTFFGLRWFEYGINYQFASSSWPPMINTCPDYLVFVQRTKTGATQPIGSCVDPLGVSTAGMSRWTWNGQGPMPPENEYYFDLDFGTTTFEELVKARCDRSIEKGVTWEGVYDGTNCLAQSQAADAAKAAQGLCASASITP